MAEGVSIVADILQGPEPLAGTIAGRFVIAERLGKGDLRQLLRGLDAAGKDRGPQLVEHLIGGRAAFDGT